VKRFLSFLSTISPVFGVLVVALNLHAAEQPIINGHKVSEIAESKIETPANSYWAGEVFPVTYRLSATLGYLGTTPSALEWNPTGMVLEDWSPATRSVEENRDVIQQTTRAYVRAAGPLNLPASKQAVNLVTGVAGDGSMISALFTLPTITPRLAIRALPQPAPSAFGNAVGQFAMKSKVTSLAVAVGESVTWTLELSGTGSWPEISKLPARVISKDFQAVAPVTKRSSKPGMLFDGSLEEDVLLIPTKAGEYQLGPVRFTYFDPKRGKYEMITTDTFVLQVAARAGGVTEGDEELHRLSSGAKILVPDAPPPLPLDPLNTRYWGKKPLPFSWLIGASLFSVGIVLAYWLRLAAERSELTDPLYPKRRARKQLEKILGELERGNLPADDVRRLLFAWQKASAELAGMTISAPTASNIARALEGSQHSAHGSSWALLWRDANAALYGEKPTLLPDWVMRAKATLSETDVAKVPLHALFQRRNLLPFAAVLLVFAMVPWTLRAADGAAEYLRGAFSVAEKAWRETIQAHPLDAHARYNLALAVAQQNRWSESAAQALAAFCLEPRNRAIRWQFALSLDRAGIEQTQINALAHGTSVGGLARMLSPSEWGWAIIVSSLGAAAASSLLLFGMYAHRNAVFRGLAGCGAIIAIGVASSGYLSLKCYGPLADEAIAVVSRNVLLCSVPTEIDTTQKTAPLPAGSLARVDRTFLGWSKLVFPNQQTGWARSDAVVPLYQ
jgi:hypothetical protein